MNDYYWVDQRQADLLCAMEDEAKKLARKQFNQAVEEWNAREEAEANKYTYVQASQLKKGMTICENSYKSRRTQKYRVTDRHAPRSKFDRHVVVTVDKTKAWRYDSQDLVMVLA